ncbi:hypothetical protein JCM10213_003329 [Rhodosporidiobolus nylandii]
MSSAALNLLNELRKADIVPPVIPEDLTSGIKGAVEIRFPTATASLGDALDREKTLEKPEIVFGEADAGASYTLIMTDPDLFKHNDPVSVEVRHWIQSSVEFDPSSKKADTSGKSPVFNSYVPPSPAYGTGQHRYIFILAKEPKGYIGPQQGSKDFPLQDPADLKDRLRFKAAEEGLVIEGVGWMRVAADAASTKDNLELTAEAIKNKIMGQ